MNVNVPHEAVILAGGLGNRLRPAVSDRPKPMAETGGRPFLAWVLEQIAGWGVRSVVLSVGYMAESITGYFGKCFGDIELRYAHEHEPLGTGGALRNALDLSTAENLLVLNGDSYCDIDGTALWKNHIETGASVTMTVVQVEDNSRFGMVQLDNRGAVQKFVSRPHHAGQPGLINGGIYVFHRREISSIPVTQYVSLEAEVFPQLIGRGLHGWLAMDARFIDIGTPESFAAAADFFSASTWHAMKKESRCFRE